MTPSMVRANGVDFACLEAGKGPLVLCLRGFPDSAWSFVPVLNRLAAAGYRAVAPFMHGYQPSGLAPGGDYRIITLGRDALALIEALGAQPLVASLAASAFALALIGSGTSLFTGRSVPFSAMRQILIGFIAAGITYGVGKVVGVSLGG